MKQFVLQNLFIVVAVGVTILALIGVAYPYSQVSQATQNVASIEVLHRELTTAIGKARSPAFVEENRERIIKLREIQERVIATSLAHGWRTPLLLDSRLIFPVPEPTDQFNFAAHYIASFAAWAAELEGQSMPTAGELEPLIRLEQAKETAAGGMPGMGADAGTPAAVSAAAVATRVRNDVVGQRAAKAKIWIDKDYAFDYYVKASAAGQRLTERQLWETLLNWWIQRDIVEAIRDINRAPLTAVTADGKLVSGMPPASVRESPIKELAWIDVNETYYKGAGAGGETIDAEPGAWGTLTGHVSDAKRDVILYSFQVVMDGRKLPLLVGQLGAKNFHTVLSYQVDTAERRGIRPGAGTGQPSEPGAVPDYGDDSVAAFTLHCEAVFMKSPPSWRPDKDRRFSPEAAGKRLDFVGKNKRLVIEVHKIGGDKPQVVLSHKDLIADPANRQLNALLAQARKDPSLQFVFLYEDLMPKVIWDESIGAAPVETGTRPPRR